MDTTESFFCLRYKHGKKIKFLSGTLQSLPLGGTHANIERRADLNLCIGASMTSTRRPNPICCYHCCCLHLVLLLCSVLTRTIPASRIFSRFYGWLRVAATPWSCCRARQLLPAVLVELARSRIAFIFMQFTCQPGLLLFLESCFCAAANSRLATLVVPRCEATNNICHIWHDGNYFRVLCASRVALWKLPVSLSVLLSVCLLVVLSVCLFVCLPSCLLTFSRSSDMIASLASAFSSIAHVASEMLISGDLKTETGK